jgi:uncharacterized membrane protein
LAKLPVLRFSVEPNGGGDGMKTYVTVGLAVLAGAALLETALIPGLVIGGAAALAPRYLPRLVPGRGRPRKVRPRRAPVVEPRPLLTASPGLAAPAAGVLAKLGMGRAVAKTVTFRVIVTTLDFSTNYLVLGELGTAAGLSAFALVAGPVFYLAHETAWNYFGTGEGSVEVLLPQLRRSDAPAPRTGVVISRALAKTVTFRTVASIVDFTATYVVVGDFVTAIGLTAFGLVLGPFVYLGHEMAWDKLAPEREPALGDVKSPPLLTFARQEDSSVPA